MIDGFIVDFYCHAAGLVVEVDGGIHDEQQGHDEARNQLLASRGLRILRLGNDEVIHHLERGLQDITMLAGQSFDKSDICKLATLSESALPAPGAPPLRRGEGAGG